MPLEEETRESGMESVNTSKSSSREMQQQQQQQDQSNSRQRRKLSFTITFVVIFSLIIGSIIIVFAILKQETEAGSLSANPTIAIRTVCSLTPYPRSCSNSLILESSSLYPSTTINPSRIFTLSLHVATRQLNDLISTTQEETLKAKNSRTLSALKDCQNLFKDSLMFFSKAVKVMDQFDPDENVFKDDKFMIRFFPGNWMTNATENIHICLTRMEYRGWNDSGVEDSRMIVSKIKKKIIHFSRPSMENSLMILWRREEILELFDPRLRSVLANLLLDYREFVFSTIVFCSQYLVLVILFILVLKL